MNHSTITLRRFGLLSGVAVAALCSGLAHADEARLNETRTFAIPAQSATTAVPLFVRQSGLQVLASARDTDGVRTNPVEGTLLVKDALYKMVGGTGLNVRTTNDGSAVLVKAGYAQEGASSAAASSAPAAATDADTVVVTGMRKSLRDALGVKRAETGIVEAISAKDIGVLPDVTIAESLARLPGVNTTRDRGNDSQASIRGIGPRMVLGLVNGREVASSEPDRNVRWEIYPSEVIAGAEVYKSSEARLISGGISGTVDLQTIRPLDYRGPEFVVRGGLVYYDGGSSLPGYDGTGWRGSGSWVKKLSSDLAIVIGVTAQKQKNGYESFQGWGYNDDSIRPANSTGAIVTGGPKVPTPWGAASEAKFLESTRYSVSTGLQWKPSDHFELKYDLLYSLFKIDEHQSQAWYGSNNWGNWAGGNINSFTNPIVVNGDLVGATTAFSQVTSVVAQYKEDKDLIVTGLNGKWSYGDWTVTADAAYSKAERSNLWQAVEMAYWPTSMTWNLVDQNISVTQSAQSQSQTPQMGSYSPGHLKDELSSVHLDFKRNLGGDFFTSVMFGLRFADRTKLDSSGNDGQATPLASVTSVPASLLGSFTFKNFTVPTLLDGDFDALKNAIYGAGTLYADPKKVAFNSEVEEKVTEGYVELPYESTFIKAPIKGNIGVRVVDVDSQSAGDSFSGGGWYQDMQGNWAFYPLIKTSAVGGLKYTKVLPSASARIELADDVYLKLGVAKVLSRPPLNELKANRTLSPIAPYSGTAGNPYLKPFEATQFDASYEYYFSKDALFAIAGYYKNVSNYIGYDQRSEIINGNSYTLVSPVNQTKDGYISGVEFTYQTPFSFIPGWEKFGVYSNLALAESDIKEFVPSNHPLEMNGLAHSTGTLDFWYAGDKLEARLGVKYHSPYTAIYGWDSAALARVEQETTLDLSASYKVSERLSVRFQGGNLLDTPLKAYYDNKPDRVLRKDYYGHRFLVDVTFKY